MTDLTQLANTSFTMDYGLLAKTAIVDLASALTPSWLKPSEKALPPSLPRPPIISFLQFSKLPVEIRLKIWAFSIEPRIVPVHLHGSGRQIEGAPVPPTSPSYEQWPSQLRLLNHGDSEYAMALTACQNPFRLERCKCSRHSIGGRHFHNLPPQVIVCQESREVVLEMGAYKQHYFSGTYNTSGFPQKIYGPPHIFSPQADPESLSPTGSGTAVRGVILNPALDIVYLRANVSSRSEIQEVCSFSVVVAREAPEIRKAVIDLNIAMPPYKFMAKARFEYWKNWGESAWWVPVASLVRMKGLREVVLVTHGNWEGGKKWLPDEWKVRTEGLWRGELLKYVEFWPAEWEGEMPVLRFVDSLEEI